MEVYDIFKGGKQTKDCHEMFNSEYSIKWMEILLDSMDKHDIEDSVIVMANTKYHNTMSFNTSKGGNKKQTLIDFCVAKNIGIDPSALKSTIWGKDSDHIKSNIKPEIV